MFTKILLKPLLISIVVSLWPILVYLVPASFIRYFDYFYLLQFALIIRFIFAFVQYQKYLEFNSYEDAKAYFHDLKRVVRLEKRSKLIALKKEKEALINKKKEEKINAEKALMDLKFKALDERKKKVL